jgi:lysophospholipase L1-like esterase
MAWGYGIASDATVRDLTTVAVGGEALKFRISNVFGNQPMLIGAASEGVSAGGSAVLPGTLHTLTFGGAPTATVPVGGLIYSDPVSTTVNAGETLAVSVWVRGSDLTTLHPCCRTDPPRDYFTPNGAGDWTGAPTLAGVSLASPFERFVDAVDVLQTTGQDSIVVLGDSITDGYNTTLRWTDVLQSRIDSLPPSERRAVINEGITANALTADVHTDDLTGGGPAGVDRLARDALSQPGVDEVVVFLGTNDLWFGATAADVIEGYREVIAETHAAGDRVIGVTLLPRSTSLTERWTPQQQLALEVVDRWIRTSGAFDGVIDAAAAVANVYNGACDPYALFPPFDSGDHLHPDPAGQVAIANSVDPQTLGLPPLPAAPPLVTAVPTPGCAAGGLL